MPATLLQTNRPDNLAHVRQLIDRARREQVPFFPSPVDWRDEVLYFLLPDRFSDGQEAGRELLTRAKIHALRRDSGPSATNWQKWAASGLRWQGGTIDGIRSKLGYLKGLGITTLWIAPVFRQRVRLDTFHGYGVQDFLDIDARFGTRGDLIELVEAAHAQGIRIILDIIINHTGDNWGYLPPDQPVSAAQNEPPFKPFPDFYGNPSDDTSKGWQLAWRDEHQEGFSVEAADIAQTDQGVWPKELQQADIYTRAGRGDLGSGDVQDPHAEHKRTDFFSLKDIALDFPNALSFLSDCFKYWIALTDCDGFRIDTLKHISLEEARNFCGAIREFADTLGKRNFLLVGEVAGGDAYQDFFADNLAVLQRNLTAALDIGNARVQLQGIGKGLLAAKEYFDDFNEKSAGFGSHRSLGNRHVSILDDHDHVAGEKIRFSADTDDLAEVKDYQVVAATAVQLFALGVPCIYYGTEQAFSGPPKSQIPFLLEEGWKDGGNYGDRYLRETMFGPEHPRAHHSHAIDIQLADRDTSLPGFGAFGTSGLHCFDTDSPAYIRLAHLCAVRSQYPILRIGRQYYRQTRNFGAPFQFPGAGELVAWSRVLDYQEALCCVNTHGGDHAFRGADVVVSAELWQAGTVFTVVANTRQIALEGVGQVYSGPHPIGSAVPVKSGAGAAAFVEIRGIGPAEVVVLVKEF